jgi:hypothetical protein
MFAAMPFASMFIMRFFVLLPHSYQDPINAQFSMFAAMPFDSMSIMRFFVLLLPHVAFLTLPLDVVDHHCC